MPSSIADQRASPDRRPGNLAGICPLCGRPRSRHIGGHDGQHLLLHRRPHLRQPGAPGRRRRAAADGASMARAPGSSCALRLDPHRADVRAARPRRHVRHDPLSAVPRRLRRRRAVHRGERLPADVRPRHDRDGDLRRSSRGWSLRRQEGQLRLDTPAGLVVVDYERNGPLRRAGARCSTSRATSLRARSRVECPELGELVGRRGLRRQLLRHHRTAAGLWPASRRCRPATIQRLSPLLRAAAQRGRQTSCIPDDRTIAGVSARDVVRHAAQSPKARRPQRRVLRRQGDRSQVPCGTGTSARMAQLAARGRLAVGDVFVHESIIGSLFDGRVERAARSASTRPSCRASPAGRA